jgi:hypothetical protein
VSAEQSSTRLLYYRYEATRLSTTSRGHDVIQADRYTEPEAEGWNGRVWDGGHDGGEQRKGKIDTFAQTKRSAYTRSDSCSHRRANFIGSLNCSGVDIRRPCHAHPSRLRYTKPSGCTASTLSVATFCSQSLHPKTLSALPNFSCLLAIPKAWGDDKDRAGGRRGIRTRTLVFTSCNTLPDKCRHFHF